MANNTPEDDKKVDDIKKGKPFNDYMDIMSKMVDRMTPSDSDRCSLCKKYICGLSQRVYDSEIGMIKCCEDCMYISIAFYARKLYAINAPQNKPDDEKPVPATDIG